MQYQCLSSVHDLGAQQWNRLAGSDYPFTRFEWFAALEDSGATSPDTGWQPHHLMVADEGVPVLLVPAFIKHHSYGEYVFDWAWADAYRQYGQDYYPKLLSAVPFTPCYGPRFLGRWSERERDFLLAAVQRECLRLQLSGWHCLFPTPECSGELSRAGLAQRSACQFHWYNRGFDSFADFVAGFASRKRKNVLKERRRVREQGFECVALSGQDIRAEHWTFFYQLYRRTYLKRSGHSGYLPEAFFSHLGASMAEHCVLVLAERDGQPVAGSLFLRDSTTLYGRYWGCLAEYDFLHFETCYYQGIDYAIAEGLSRFDGGAQGEHKLARGFEPVITYSNHWLADERFNAAIDDFVYQEADMVQEYYAEARGHLPFSQTDKG